MLPTTHSLPYPRVVARTNNRTNVDNVQDQEILTKPSQFDDDFITDSQVYFSKPYEEDIAVKEIFVDESKTKQWRAEVQELVNSSPFQKNLVFARAISKEVRKHITLGTNTEKDAQRSSLSFSKKVELIQKLRHEVDQKVAAYRQLHNGNWPTQDQSYVMCYEVMKKYGFGQCGELTKAAFVEAQKNPEIRNLSYCSTTVGKHSFLVIGEMSDENAVICDVWAEKCYSIRDFHEMQKPEHDVRYAKEYYLPENLWLFSNKRAPAPYLEGNLEVQFSWSR